MQTLILGSSILAAFLGGILALFAPCCIVSLLPTYMAAMLRVTRWQLVQLTGVFALGVAVVLLPVVLGIGALGLLFNQAHREIFFLGGVLMLGMAVSTLLGKGWSLPMPMLRRPDIQGRIGGTFLLGIFSGIVSSCCAPVLSGVLVLSATATSWLHITAIGLAYVLGMVTPLFFASLLWDRLGLAGGDLFRSRSISIPLGRTMLSCRLTDLGAFAIFAGMGGLMVGLALTGRGTYTPQFLVRLNHWGSDRFASLADRLSFLPEWAMGVGLLALICGLAALAWPRDRAGLGRAGTAPRAGVWRRRHVLSVLPGSRGAARPCRTPRRVAGASATRLYGGRELINGRPRGGADRSRGAGLLCVPPLDREADHAAGDS